MSYFNLYDDFSNNIETINSPEQINFPTQTNDIDPNNYMLKRAFYSAHEECKFEPNNSSNAFDHLREPFESTQFDNSILSTSPTNDDFKLIDKVAHKIKNDFIKSGEKIPKVIENFDNFDGFGNFYEQQIFQNGKKSTSSEEYFSTGKNQKYYKRKNISDANNFFHTIKPFDSLIVKPLIEFMNPLINIFRFKCENVGFMFIIANCMSMYYLYNDRNNLVWTFVFCAFILSFIDDAIDMRYNWEKNKTKTNKSKHFNIKKFINELANILIKIIGIIIIYIILSISKLSVLFSLTNKTHLTQQTQPTQPTQSAQPNQIIYFLLFIGIVLFLLSYHLNKYQNKNKNMEKNKNIDFTYVEKKINIIKQISLIILVLLVGLIFKLQYDNHVQLSIKEKNDLLNIFMIKEA
jgi:hypothetical protein